MKNKFLCYILWILFFVGCERKPSEREIKILSLETESNYLTHHLPIEIEGLGSFYKVDVDTASHLVNFRIYVRDDELFVNLKNNKNFNDVLNTFELDLVSNIIYVKESTYNGADITLKSAELLDLRELTERICDVGYNINIILKQPSNDKAIEEFINNKEIKDLLNKYPSSENAELENLKSEIRNLNLKLPLLEDGMKLTSIDLNDNNGERNLIFSYEIENSIINELSNEEFYNEFNKTVEDEIYEKIKDTPLGLQLSRLNSGYIYHFYSSQNPVGKNFKFTAEQVRILKD